jgi:hypothetical protein
VKKAPHYVSLQMGVNVMCARKPCSGYYWQPVYRQGGKLLVWAWDLEHGVMRQLIIKRICRLIDVETGEDIEGADITRLMPVWSRLN